MPSESGAPFSITYGGPSDALVIMATANREMHIHQPNAQITMRHSCLTHDSTEELNK
jgi:hypothetical protein